MSNPAETYETYMVPALFGPWASHLIGRASPRPGERALDIACGTGVVARKVAPMVGPTGAVDGLDVSPHMLAVAIAAAERDGLDITWSEGRAEALPYPDGSFDLALCQFALMFFTDRAAALSEMHRVLGTRGRIVLSVFQGIERHPFYVALDEAIGRRLGSSGVGDIFALGDASEVSGLLAGAGFQQVTIESDSMTAYFPNPEGFLAGEIDVDTASIPAMQQLGESERRDLIAAISDEMSAPLREFTRDGHVAIPFHVHIASARVAM
jgi:SAM-dependent methyltransferase